MRYSVPMDDPGDDLARARPSRARFRTTRWSVVRAALGGESPEVRAAMSELCGTYWYPLYAFARRKGLDPESAGDLVQGFFARLLETRGLDAVDAGKGKFRSFLMASCAHHLANRRDHDRALKRGGGRAPIPIDRLDGERRYLREPSHEMTAERLFERRWALTLLEGVLDRLEAEMAALGKATTFEALRPALIGSADRAPHAEVADALGLSAEAARAAASRLRRRYRELLREEVAATIGDPSEVDDEIRSLFEALGG